MNDNMDYSEVSDFSEDSEVSDFSEDSEDSDFSEWTDVDDEDAEKNIIREMVTAAAKKKIKELNLHNMVKDPREIIYKLKNSKFYITSNIEILENNINTINHELEKKNKMLAINKTKLMKVNNEIDKYKKVVPIYEKIESKKDEIIEQLHIFETMASYFTNTEGLIKGLTNFTGFKPLPCKVYLDKDWSESDSDSD